jgi:multidrug efflux pump subunit AcrB
MRDTIRVTLPNGDTESGYYVPVKAIRHESGRTSVFTVDTTQSGTSVARQMEVRVSDTAYSTNAQCLMLKAFGMFFVAIVVLLVIQFDSISKTLIIITTLPLALIGAIGGLWMTDNPLGFMPQLGILSLFGIVLNTGIIFIEFADVLIHQKAEQNEHTGPIAGMTREEFRQCLVDAGKQRLLPIFLTTATTVGGLLPLALGGGPLWVGMAWLMIYGLLMATILTLVVVPALYAIVAELFRIQPVVRTSTSPQKLASLPA